MQAKPQSLCLKIINGGFVSQYQQFPSKKKHFKFEINGNVFQANGVLVPEGVRQSFSGDHVCHSPEEILGKDCIDGCPLIEGRTLYAGHFMNHYGHFITDGLGRLYPLVKSLNFDRVAFLPFIFENHLRIELMKDFHRLIFMALGVMPKDVFFVNETIIYKRNNF